ncbi:MAG: pyridoxal-phosphate dependent enzyme [bacterium]|nr:pyridoxal-phosphate dependent enzyme [bacterium]
MSPSYADVLAAADRIAPHIHRTPVVTCAALDELCGARLFLKCENLQKVGAFKARGATNAVLSLSDDEAARGVATHSSGNHAQALALAARRRGVPAWIVMPTTAPAVKRAAVAGYGAVIVPCEPTLAAREQTLREVVARTGAVFVPPYDDERIIAGQGTAALELAADAPGLDRVLCPVGGGGLLAGTAVALSGCAPAVKVVGCEPDGADDTARSLAAGHRLPAVAPRSVCDGLLTSVGERNFPLIARLVAGVWTVPDEAVIAAMRLLFERAKLVVEPSGAIGLAAAVAHRRELAGGRVGIILSGGNVDLDRLPWLPPREDPCPTR